MSQNKNVSPVPCQKQVQSGSSGFPAFMGVLALRGKPYAQIPNSGPEKMLP